MVSMWRRFRSWLDNFRNTPRWEQEVVISLYQLLWTLKQVNALHPEVTFKSGLISISNQHRSHFYYTQFVFFPLRSPERRSPCSASATTTSRTSAAPPSATSSSASCTQRWRTTRSTMPSRYTRPVPILRLWRPRLHSTTLAATPRSRTHTLSLVMRQMIEKWEASLPVTPSIPPFMCKLKCFAAGRCFIRFLQFSLLLITQNFFDTAEPSVPDFPLTGSLEGMIRENGWQNAPTHWAKQANMLISL